MGRKEQVEKEEIGDEEHTIYSISNNEDEEDIYENLQIKNEENIMNFLLGNNESKKLFTI